MLPAFTPSLSTSLPDVSKSIDLIPTFQSQSSRSCTPSPRPHALAVPDTNEQRKPVFSLSPLPPGSNFTYGGVRHVASMGSLHDMTFTAIHETSPQLKPMSRSRSCEGNLCSWAENLSHSNVAIARMNSNDLQLVADSILFPLESDVHDEEEQELAGIWDQHLLSKAFSQLALVWPYVQAGVFSLKLVTSILEFLVALPGGSEITAVLDSIANLPISVGVASDVFSEVTNLVTIIQAKTAPVIQHHVANQMTGHLTLMHPPPPPPTHLDHPSQTLFSIMDNLDVDDGQTQKKKKGLNKSDNDSDDETEAIMDDIQVQVQMHEEGNCCHQCGDEEEDACYEELVLSTSRKKELASVDDVPVSSLAKQAS
mmetsp:Transcript_12701/g.20761  ORF Transcript_12701/g.20761 Transcript_12701/m.20761 type:complete len:368 (+) Transcript_12701:120-1223(+)